MSIQELNINTKSNKAVTAISSNFENSLLPSAFKVLYHSSGHLTDTDMRKRDAYNVVFFFLHKLWKNKPNLRTSPNSLSRALMHSGTHRINQLVAMGLLKNGI